MSAIREHDLAQTRYLLARLREVPGVRVLAADVPAEERIALATFVVDAPGMTQENVARALCDLYGVCVSGGVHCAHVLHARLHLDGTARASAHAFNTTADLDMLIEGVRSLAT
jgi:cysteine desulfurase/selenocysteine lyase